MTKYIAKFKMTDGVGESTILTYDLGDIVTGPTEGDNYLEAESAANAIALSLAAVTDAVITWLKLESTVSESDALALTDEMISEEAVLSVYINQVGTLAKYAVTRIPCPDPGIFLTDHVTVDINDVNLQSYLSDLVSYTRVSDGEQINALLGTGGLKSGFRRTKARRFDGN